jgi:hypothetical protein
MAIRRKAKKIPAQTASASSAQNQFCVGPIARPMMGYRAP